MSKMDGLRAMREARYKEAAARAAKNPTTPKAAQRPASKAAAAPPPPGDAAAEAGPGSDLCGHRNMSGRTCTRERGHAAKSHRYS